MNYTVLWRPTAEGQLAALWTNATDRNAIAAAADLIDKMLQHDPLGEGESRAGADRLLFLGPLAALYSVDQGDRTVHVRAVGLSRSRP